MEKLYRLGGVSFLSLLFRFLIIVKFGFQIIQLLNELNVLARVALVIAQVQNKVGYEQRQQNKHGVLHQPDHLRKVQEKLKILLLAIHVNGK